MGTKVNLSHSIVQKPKNIEENIHKPKTSTEYFDYDMDENVVKDLLTNVDEDEKAKEPQNRTNGHFVEDFDSLHSSYESSEPLNLSNNAAGDNLPNSDLETHVPTSADCDSDSNFNSKTDGMMSSLTDDDSDSNFNFNPESLVSISPSKPYECSQC